MILNIAIKDFLLNLVSARFVIGFLLCLFLIPFTMFVSIDDYNEQFRVYELEKANAEKKFKEVRVYSQLRPEIVKPPEPLGVFSHGISSNVGNRVKIWLGEKPLLAEGITSLRDNPLLNSFFTIDFISILAIILSLLALIFTYDSCTGEKELGTLKMQLSNSISRYKILLGKVIGVYLTILPIILFCYILAFLLVLNYYDIAFSFNDWIRILLLFLASILFLSVFIFIGQFISTRMLTSKASIMVCLFVWVFLIFIVPNLSVYLAESFIKVQSQDNLQYALGDLDVDYSKKCNEYRKTLENPTSRAYPWMSSSRDNILEMYGVAKSLAEFHRRTCEFSVPLLIDYADKKWAFQKSYLDELDRQRSVAENVSLISPSELFRFVCSAICRTDVESQYRFMNRTRVYREEFINYLKDRKIFSSFSYFTAQPPETFLTEDEVQEVFRKEKWNLYGPQAYPYLDLSDVPVFQLQLSNILSDIRNALFKIFALLIVSIILFWLSFVSFTKYDAR